MKIEVTDELLSTAIQAAKLVADATRIKPNGDVFGHKSSLHTYVPRFSAEASH